jgi:hypothetical protein
LRRHGRDRGQQRRGLRQRRQPERQRRRPYSPRFRRRRLYMVRQPSPMRRATRKTGPRWRVRKRDGVPPCRGRIVVWSPVVWSSCVGPDLERQNLAQRPIAVECTCGWEGWDTVKQERPRGIGLWCTGCLSGGPSRAGVLGVSPLAPWLGGDRVRYALRGHRGLARAWPVASRPMAPGFVAQHAYNGRRARRARPHPQRPGPTRVTPPLFAKYHVGDFHFG